MLTVILAGGESRRMGRDKALLPLENGETLSQRLIRRYATLGPVALSVDRPGRFCTHGALELTDRYPGQGPLNGLIAAFSETAEELVLLTATDLPNGSCALARALAARLGDADACVPLVAGRPEPLMAVYRRRCLRPAEECLRAGERSMRALLRRLSVNYVKSLPGFGEAALAAALENVNTPRDYERLLTEMKGVRSMNSIFTRRSIRRFLDRPVEEEKVDRLLRAAMQAPSAMNAQPWEFLVITDPQDRVAITEMSKPASMCRYAPVVIANLVNRDRCEGHGTWWIQDMAAATENMLLQAAEEGLGAVWVGFYPVEERIQKFQDYFALPEQVMPFSLVALGYSERENYFLDKYDPSRVHRGKW